MALGLRSKYGVAAPPFTKGPYVTDQHYTFSQGVNGVMNGGDCYYVDANLSSSGDGSTWENAFITIAEGVAASLAKSGKYDTIFVKGGTTTVETSDYAESVSVTAAQVGLRIIGVGNRPEGVMWTVGTADGVILTLAAKDCYVSGFRFRPNGATSGGAIDIAVTGLGSTVENCIFRSTTETALYGIRLNSVPDITISGNVFTSLATAILGTQAVKLIYRARILNNLFDDKVDDAGINIAGRCCLIKGNDFSADTTLLIDTYKDSVGERNIVTGNTLDVTAYETNCVGSSTDSWIGNFCNDVGNTDVGDNGITIDYPHQA